MWRVKAVSFDLWETLILETDGADRRRSEARCASLLDACTALGLHLSLGEIVRAHRALGSWLAGFWSRNEDVSHLDQIRFIVEEASNGASSVKPEWMRLLSEAYVKPFFMVPPELDPDAPLTLAQLKERGKRLCLISNVGRTPSIALRRFLEQSRVMRFFDTMVFSDEVRVRKPGARIFRVAAERLEISPQEMVHVGDNPRADVWGAKNAGLRAVLLASMVGHDREAEADPSSLISLSGSVEASLVSADIAADGTVTSIRDLPQVITRLEQPS